jgi:hypothetical protein
MYFVRHPAEDVDKKIKALFIMGGSVHIKAMFDLDFAEDSFCDILVNSGLEIHSFNIFGSGPDPKPGPIGNMHQLNIDYAVELIKKFNIEHVISFSYGCFVGYEVAKLVKIKSLILIDPCTTAAVEKIETPDGKYIYKKKDLFEAVKYNGYDLTPNVINAYLKYISNGDSLVTASYPAKTGKSLVKYFLDKNNIQEVMSHCPLRVFFSRHSVESIRDAFPESTRIFYPIASHYFLLEEHRYQLSLDVIKFIEENN